MSIMFLLIGFSLFVALVFLATFLWAVRTGQYEDKVTPAVRVLFDDAPPATGAQREPDTPAERREK